ncbi:AfsR/SARP family transcriptional regulator [Saccharothrix syringae]|uniref:AfsR/SARP family transcriptional regulator n=1 Tax=Saccharothrix syringae TaxID=103733 RepID=A0A5Q0H4E6_SACSY|nr:AfsR/SARP family transcriptional regulator [Saccharothrix syringae]QFZ21127.1 AfsR/SARP family transcriptional regulator [Saccharothrix syringae]
MRIGILGPVELGEEGRPVPVAGPQLRCVLAVLASEAGRAVPLPRLVEALWEVPPPAARGTVQVYASRLRKLLSGSGIALVSAGGGYRLDVDPADVDVHRFRDAVRRAREAPDVALRRQLLAGALAEWRGPAFADAAGGPLRDRVVVALAEERLAALEERLEADLELGRHHDVVGELAALAAEHPGRERLTAALMLALHRCGRRVEALEVYRRLRALLVERAGVEPGPRLRHLHQVILADDGTAAPAAREVPRQLPAPVRDLTARDGHLAALDGLLAASGGQPLVVALVGTPGVGKTALALGWAHRVAARFPDGQLHADLRGHGPDEPVAPEVVLGGFLRALGVHPGQVPETGAERSALCRSLLSGRRVLVVLDDARSAEQVRPLLPGTAGCAVVVTSRVELAGLATRDSAHLVTVGPLAADDGLALLRRVVGARVDAEPVAAARLVGLCAGLPLALRVVAHRALRRPSVPLAALADQLADRARRMDLLSPPDDPTAAVRGVFSWSYRALPPAAAALFRALAVLPGTDFGAGAAAAAADDPDVAGALEVLVAGHLVEETALDRYRLHDLLRAYAAELAGQSGPAGQTGPAESAGQTEPTGLSGPTRPTGPDERHAAAIRVLDWYLAHAEAAVALVETETDDLGGVFADRDAAAAWLAAERANLVAVVRFAAAVGAHEHAWRLPAALWRHWFTLGLVDDLTAAVEVGLASARTRRDPRAQGDLLNILGTAHYTAHRYDTALEVYEQALVLREALGDRVGTVRTLTNTAVVHYLAGRYRDAVEQGERVLARWRDLDDAFGEAMAHTALGGFHLRLGRADLALEHGRRALALFEKLGHRFGQAASVLNLGHVHRHADEPDRAAEHYRDALERFRELGDPRHEGEARCGLGAVERGRGRFDRAADHLDAAAALGAVVDDAALRCEVALETGLLRLAQGRPEPARAHFEQARRLGDPYQRACALHGLARAGCAAGGHGADAWRAAAGEFAALGVPDRVAPGCERCSAAVQRAVCT